MAERIYVALVGAVSWPFRRLGLLAWLDRRRPPRPVHWLRSLCAIHDVEDMVSLGVPWWSYRAIDEVEGWLAGRDAIRVFEWGSGASTVWLADRAASVVAVEHHAGFADTVRSLTAAHRPGSDVELHTVEPVERAEPVVSSRRKGHARLDFEDYVATIDRLGGEYDLICIDGRAREACLERAVEHLADGGIIVFDNTDRAPYRDAIAEHPELEARHLRGLTPALPYPTTTTVLRRRPPTSPAPEAGHDASERVSEEATSGSRGDTGR